MIVVREYFSHLLDYFANSYRLSLRVKTDIYNACLLLLVYEEVRIIETIIFQFINCSC